MTTEQYKNDQEKMDAFIQGIHSCNVKFKDFIATYDLNLNSCYNCRSGGAKIGAKLMVSMCDFISKNSFPQKIDLRIRRAFKDYRMFIYFVNPENRKGE